VLFYIDVQRYQSIATQQTDLRLKAALYIFHRRVLSLARARALEALSALRAATCSQARSERSTRCRARRGGA
jgi:hypothetical protein